MQIVINIDEKVYNEYMNLATGRIPTYKACDIAWVLKNGTVLPKGHGSLGDLDKIKKEMQNYHDDCAKTSEYTRLGFETAIAVVEDAETIIEADKKGEIYAD